MGLREKTPGALRQFQARAKRLVGAGFRAQLSQVLAATAMKQVADEFQGEHDPYGNGWKPLARGTRPAAKAQHAKILRRTGVMAASAAAVASSGGFRFTMAFPAPVHQNGGVIAPHSRLGGHLVKRNAKTGAFAKRGAKSYVVERAGRSTFGEGIVIPRRQIVPTRATGGLGPIWARAFNLEAGRLIKAVMGRG